MKLLLTSDGLTNDRIDHALQTMVGKEAVDINLAYIPTGALPYNPDRPDNSWSERHQQTIEDRRYNMTRIELTELGKTALMKTLEASDVICFGGGNGFFLSHWVQRSGLADELQPLLEKRVYVGISAGSALAGRSFELSSHAINNREAFLNGDLDELGPKGKVSDRTLNYVDIIFRPHLNKRIFTVQNYEKLEEYAKLMDYPVYALSDESALQVEYGSIAVVSGDGAWLSVDGEQYRNQRRLNT